MPSSLAILIAAGGSGSRFGGPKLLQEFRGLPLLCHSLKNFDAKGRLFVLATPPDALEQYQNIIYSYLVNFKGVIKFAPGGPSRFASVANAFTAVMQHATRPDFVAIHDAARPLADAPLLERCLEAAENTGAAIAAHRVTDTIHFADDQEVLTDTPPRELLWAAETPQVFRTDLYARALQMATDLKTLPTDDASFVRRVPGTQIKIVENSRPNPKITYRYDLIRYQG